jgi:hypothetical protein
MGVEIVTSPEAALHHQLNWTVEAQGAPSGRGSGDGVPDHRHVIPMGTRWAFVGDTYFAIDFDARELKEFGPAGLSRVTPLPEPPPLIGSYNSTLVIPGGSGEVIMGYHEPTQSLVEIDVSTGSVSARPFPLLDERKQVVQFFGAIDSLVVAAWGSADDLIDAAIERGLQTLTQTVGVVRGTPAHVDVIGDYPAGGFWFSAAITANGFLPNTPMFAVGVGKDRVYVANTHSSDIRVFDPGGVHIRTLRMEGIPIRYSQAERDSIIEANIEMQPGLRPGRDVWGEWVTVWPSVDWLIVDSEGWLWALMPGIGPDRATRWVVFDPDGRMRGWVPTSHDPALEIRSIGEAHVLGILRGPGSTRTVEFLRLVR